ncbi:MAG: hypothetical protein F4Y60_04575, partial [Boseongicola sp. SB0664_bin_43]|nr:hypothetical protein [Boseongicola sp. SB0664_bin_43]
MRRDRPCGWQCRCGQRVLPDFLDWRASQAVAASATSPGYARRRLSQETSVSAEFLQSLDEPLADTTSPAGKMILTVFGGIAEFERSLILARMEEGRKAATARNVAFGR